MQITEQIKAGKLRCVVQGVPLTAATEGASLVGGDTTARYPVLGGVPVILKDEKAMAAYRDANPTMQAEYQATAVRAPLWSANTIKKLLVGEVSTQASKTAYAAFLASVPAGACVLSVGGGPARPDARFTNLNIGLFPNVDIVADAHDLPYMDGSVDGIYCEAVLEHLERPARAVEEMLRVLKPGGLVYAATPFMQAYHGYPHHYQNFTLQGHALLFSARGFAVEASGLCVGPMTAMSVLLARWMTLLPRPFGSVLQRAVQVLTLPVRALDRCVQHHPQAHILCSTTFVLAKKPQ